MPLLEVRNLAKSFPARVMTDNGPRQGLLRAVDGVSLTVDQSETLGVVGESGCGKTTLSRCILLLEQPTSGEVIFDGADMRGLSGEQLRKLRRGMQIVFQDPYASLDPRWTVGQTIAEPLRIHNIVPAKERRGEVERLLGEVGLPRSAADRYPHEFSGGQRQRVGIARALALRPRFLIADEPVSALDVSVRAQILNLLRSAQAEHKLGMLFIAHDLGAVRQVSNRIAVMYLGKILEEGSTDQIFDNPRNPYTRSLLAAIPSVRRLDKSARLAQAAGDPPSALNLPSGCRFRTRCPFAQEICAAEAPPLVEIEPGHTSLCHFADQLPPFEWDAGIQRQRPVADVSATPR
jgi:oligopeptide/dipeptide ABC transporter ATP-binding protein